MKRLLVGLSSCLPATLAALTPIDGHVDVENSFQGGTWTQEFVYGEQGGVNEVHLSHTEGFLVVPDKLWQSGFANDGTRVTRPAGAEWDFLGVEAGEPFWWLTQADNNICWPGFENKQFGTFAAYDEPDPRTFGTLPFVTIQLLDLRYEGQGTGQFNLWQGFGFSQTFWMSANGTGATLAERGIDSTDKFFVLEGGHDHANWAFSDLGLYFLTVQSSAYLASSPTTQVVSDPSTIVVAVGTFATWQATEFDFAQLSDPAVSGPDGDPDRDGRSNLAEYSFGTDPNVPDSAGISVALDDGRLAVGFKRRTADSNPQVDYFAKFGPDLQTAAWQEASTQSATPLAEGWEFVEAQDPVPNAPRRFGRVELQLQNAIAYP